MEIVIFICVQMYMKNMVELGPEPYWSGIEPENTNTELWIAYRTDMYYMVLFRFRF